MPPKLFNQSCPTPRPAARNRKDVLPIAFSVLICGLILLAPSSRCNAQALTVNLNNAAISLSGLTNFTYTQDFNSLITSGTANLTTLNTTALRGLQIARSGGPGTATILADNGGNTAGSIYSYITSGGTNPRFGTLTTTTSTGDLYYGFRFLNDTNDSISSMSVSFTGEIWRAAQANFAETLEFSSAVFGAGQGGLGGTGYTIAPESLQYSKGVPNSGSQALDVTAGREIKSGTITFDTPVAAGQEVWIRWLDRDVVGADNGMGIDNLNVVLTPTPAPPGFVTALIGSGVGGANFVFVRWRRKRRLRKKQDTGREE